MEKSHWVKHKNGAYSCSNCGVWFPRKPLLPAVVSETVFRYCPNCGFAMVVGDEKLSNKSFSDLVEEYTDIFVEFIQIQTRPDLFDGLPSSDVYDKFKHFCDEECVEPLSKNDFDRFLSIAGYRIENGVYKDNKKENNNG